MKLVVASDERTKLTDSIIKYLKQKGHRLTLLGHLADREKKWKWVEIGKEAARVVASGKVDRGVILCSSGTGICMAANKVKGARAALCWSAKVAKAARKWDNANILCLAYDFINEKYAKKIIDAFFSQEFDEEGLNEAHKLEE